MVKRAETADFLKVEGFFSKVRQPATDARLAELKRDVMQAYLQSLPKEGVIKAMLALWNAGYNIEGVRLWVEFFGSTSEGHTKTDLISWLVENDFPFCEYDFLETVVDDAEEGKMNSPKIKEIFMEYCRSQQGDLDDGSGPATETMADLVKRLAALEARQTKRNRDFGFDSDSDSEAHVHRGRSRRPRHGGSPVSEDQGRRSASRRLKRSRDDDASDYGDDDHRRSRRRSDYDGSGVDSDYDRHGRGDSRGPRNAYTKHVRGLRRGLAYFEYINVTKYANARLAKLKLQEQFKPSRKVVMDVSGQMRTLDDDSDLDTSWDAFMSGYLFVVSTMHDIPSRAKDVGDRIQFLSWLTDEFPGQSSSRAAFGAEFMFKYRESSNWMDMVRVDTTLLLKFCMVSTGGTKSSLSVKKAKPSATPLRELPPGRMPTLEQPGAFCLSRISKAKSCTRKFCKFKHVCPYCDNGETHSAAECPKAPE
jgi:hypothetical protein